MKSSPSIRWLKFIYSEKATKFCEIFTLILTTVHTVKSKVKILQNFVAFSEYTNFTTYCQIEGEDFVNICGLLRKLELYRAAPALDFTAYNKEPDKHSGNV